MAAFIQDAVSRYSAVITDLKTSDFLTQDNLDFISGVIDNNTDGFSANIENYGEVVCFIKDEIVFFTVNKAEQLDNNVDVKFFGKLAFMMSEFIDVKLFNITAEMKKVNFLM